MSGLYLSDEDLKSIGLTRAQAIKRLLHKWGGQRKRLMPIFERQNGRCAITNEPLPLNGKLTHLDHRWTMAEAAQAVVDGLPIKEAFVRLWDESNLRAILASENYKRNRKVHMDSADDGPEVDLIMFFNSFPHGAGVAPMLRTPVETWRRMCALRKS